MKQNNFKSSRKFEVKLSRELSPDKIGSLAGIATKYQASAQIEYSYLYTGFRELNDRAMRLIQNLHAKAGDTFEFRISSTDDRTSIAVENEIRKWLGIKANRSDTSQQGSILATA